MSCKGCSGAVNRVLGKMEGVESFDIDMEQQKVTVVGNVDPEAVFQTVSKTGKKTEYWQEPAPSAETTESKPAETTESKPAEVAEAKPEEVAESKPTEVAESKPAETAAPVATA